jgi:hypothetical protein
VLRKDEIKATTESESQGAGNKQEPTPQQKIMQEKYAPQDVNFNKNINPLANYSRLVQQQSGLQGSFMDGYIMSSLESRRTPNKVADETSDGYSLLANTFGLSEMSNKTQMKSKKMRKLNMQQLV